MTTPDSSPQNNKDGWAKPVGKLKVDGTYQEAVNLNVDGRKLIWFNPWIWTAVAKNL